VADDGRRAARAGHGRGATPDGLVWAGPARARRALPAAAAGGAH